MGSMDPASGDSDLQHDPAAAPAAAASPEQGAEASASAAPGSSPSHRPPAASEHSAPGPESEVGKPKIPQDVSEVSLADSFIMSVLRGWRLLKVASLTPEGTRDIVSTTHKISKISTPSAKPCLPFGMNSCLVTVIHHMLDRLGAGHNSNANARAHSSIFTPMGTAPRSAAHVTRLSVSMERKGPLLSQYIM